MVPRRTWYRSVVALACSAPLLASSGLSNGSEHTNGNAHPTQEAAQFGKELTRQREPLTFVQNRGQGAPETRFLASRGDSLIELLRDRIRMSRLTREPAGWCTTSVSLVFRGAAASARIVGETEARAKHAYYLGADPSAWAENVRSYHTLLYRGLYPGVDVRVREHTGSGQLEYDLLLAPSADLTRVALGVEGGTIQGIDADGSILIETPLGVLRQPAPLTWHVLPGGGTAPVGCSYRVLDATTYTFDVERREPGLELVIDPRVEWETYLSSIASSSADTVKDIHVRSVGPGPEDRIVTVVGTTRNQWFLRPRNAPFMHPNVGGDAIYVSVFDRRVTSGNAPSNAPCTSGTTGCWDQLVYSVVFGGSGDDVPLSLDVDDNGVLTIGGHTASADFVTTPGAYDNVFGGSREGFLLRWDPDSQNTGPANRLYATYFGGSQDDEVRAIAYENGTIYGVAVTNSPDIPEQGSYLDPTEPRPIGSTPGMPSTYKDDVVVFTLDLAQAGPAQATYLTYFGSNEADDPRALTLEGSPPRILVGGRTFDGWAPRGMPGEQTWPIFPVEPIGQLFGPNTAFMPLNSTGWEGFFIRIDPTQTGTDALLYSTYIGANGDDVVHDIAVTAGGRVYLAGSASNMNFPDGLVYNTNGKAAFSQWRGARDGFVLEITEEMREMLPAPNGGREPQVPYYSFIGTANDDEVLDIEAYGGERPPGGADHARRNHGLPDHTRRSPGTSQRRTGSVLLAPADRQDDRAARKPARVLDPLRRDPRGKFGAHGVRARGHGGHPGRRHSLDLPHHLALRLARGRL